MKKNDSISAAVSASPLSERTGGKRFGVDSNGKLYEISGFSPPHSLVGGENKVPYVPVGGSPDITTLSELKKNTQILLDGLQASSRLVFEERCGLFSPNSIVNSVVEHVFSSSNGERDSKLCDSVRKPEVESLALSSPAPVTGKFEVSTVGSLAEADGARVGSCEGGSGSDPIQVTDKGWRNVSNCYGGNNNFEIGSMAERRLSGKGEEGYTIFDKEFPKLAPAKPGNKKAKEAVSSSHVFLRKEPEGSGFADTEMTEVSFPNKAGLGSKEASVQSMSGLECCANQSHSGPKVNGPELKNHGPSVNGPMLYDQGTSSIGLDQVIDSTKVAVDKSLRRLDGGTNQLKSGLVWMGQS